MPLVPPALICHLCNVHYVFIGTTGIPKCMVLSGDKLSSTIILQETLAVITGNTAITANTVIPGNTESTTNNWKHCH